MGFKAEIPRIRSAAYAGGGNSETLPVMAFAEFAFSGRSNVGKSSLLNALLGRRNLVRVSKNPGATRQVNLFQAIFVGGASLVFADLPGYGYAKRSRDERTSWGKQVEGYLLERSNLRGVLCLVDARRGVEPDDLELFEFLAQRPTIELAVVATKLDKLSKSERRLVVQRMRAQSKRRVFGTSAETGEGLAMLWSWMVKGSEAQVSE